MKHSNDNENKQSTDNQSVFAATSEVMSAYVSNNPVSTTELPNLDQGGLLRILEHVKPNRKKYCQRRNTKPAVPISKVYT